ncbi:unnamed protein product [Coccothraustes coccothraustes]
MLRAGGRCFGLPGRRRARRHGSEGLRHLKSAVSPGGKVVIVSSPCEFPGLFESRGFRDVKGPQYLEITTLSHPSRVEFILKCSDRSALYFKITHGRRTHETRDGERRGEFSGACGFCAKFEVGECFEVGRGRLRGAHKAAGAAAAVPRSATARRCPEEPPPPPYLCRQSPG